MTVVRTSAIAALAAHVADHPWRAMGQAFLLGAWLGLEPPRSPRNSLARTALAIVGSITLRVVREAALRELVERATCAARDGRTASPPAA